LNLAEGKRKRNAQAAAAAAAAAEEIKQMNKEASKGTYIK